MIRQSFIFLERVGKSIERNLWNQGINDWDAFFQKKKINGISKARKSYYERKIKEARKELYSFNSSYFLGKLPNNETWRLYDFFKEDSVFLDIETSGYYGDITVVGLYDGLDTKTMVRGINLDKNILKKELLRYKLIVTFNGSSFDLPIIRRYFNNVLPAIPHIDLRHVCSRAGLKGGLKEIEKTLGIKRDKKVENIKGDDAVYLWNMWKATRKKDYLELLVKYNEEDIINLKTISDFITDYLWKKIRAEPIKINNQSLF